jgi:hypothetical protein
MYRKKPTPRQERKKEAKKKKSRRSYVYKLIWVDGGPIYVGVIAILFEVGC